MGGRIDKPMLAVTLPADVDPPFSSARLGATPKIDGIRALIVAGRLVSRTLKPIPNLAIRAALEAVLPEGADGEIMAGAAMDEREREPVNQTKRTTQKKSMHQGERYVLPSAPSATFQQCTSMVMSVDKVPPPGTTTFFMFDYVRSDTEAPYSERVSDMEDLSAMTDETSARVRVVRLVPTPIEDRQQLDAYEATCLRAGYEGVMLRRMDGRYKGGRSTLREGLLMKIKRFTDAEATIVGFEELCHAASYPDCSVSSSGLLGAFVVRMGTGDGGRATFKIGTGFTMAERAEMWSAREGLVRSHQQVKFKYMKVGVKDAPRFPVFLGLRHPDDM